MKPYIQRVILCLTLSGAILLSGCAAAGKGPHIATSSVAAARDLTIKATEVNIPGIEEKMRSPRPGNAILCFSKPCRTLDELYKNSEQIVQCRVDKVAFTIMNGVPYTVMDVTLTDSLKGELKAGDRISVVQFGGFMTLQDEVDAFHDEAHFANVPADKWKDMILEKKQTPEPYPEAGESYVFFLGPTNGGFTGAYTPANEYEGRYKLDNGGNYARYMPDGEAQPVIDVAGTSQSADRFTYRWLRQQIWTIAKNG